MIRAGSALVMLVAVPLALSAQTIAITGGKIYPVSGPPLVYPVQFV